MVVLSIVVSVVQCHVVNSINALDNDVLGVFKLSVINIDVGKEFIIE